MNALVTGASSGIGWELAQRLAQRGYHLILVARREDRLQELARSLPYGATVLPRDLALPGAAEELFMTCQELELTVEVLVNNAGFGRVKEHTSLTVEETEQMGQLNMLTLSGLCQLFGAEMKERGHGLILNVGSVAGYLPIPYIANYAATKAFVTSFTMALREELGRHGIHVTLLTPGPTRSEFGQNAQDEGDFLEGKPGVMESAEVAEAGLQALFANDAEVIPGLSNAAIPWLVRCFPRSLLVKVAAGWRRKRGDA